MGHVTITSIFADDIAIPAWAAAALGLLTGITGLLTGVLAVYYKYRVKMREFDNQAAKDIAIEKKDQYTASLDGWKNLAQEYEEQSDRRERILQSQQLVIEALQKENVVCRESSAEQRQAIFFLYDQVKRLHGAVLAAGQNPGPLPELPPMREPPPVPDGAAAFLARQTAQNTTLVRESDAVLKEQKANLSGTAANVGTSHENLIGRK